MESLHRFLDEDKDNGRGEMGVIIYGSFLISNCHYGGGGGKVTRAWKYMQKWVKGGKVRAPTPIGAYMEAEGGIGIHVDPPVTVVLDTVGFRVAVMGCYDGCRSTFCNDVGAHQSNCNKEICRCH